MEAPPVHTDRPQQPAAGRVMSMQPDALLCALAARGNEDAFGVLHARYRQQVFAFVFHLLGRPGGIDDAEDLTQEIMQKAYANLNTRRNGGSFKAWLFRIARNHTFDHIRASKPNAVSLDDADAPIEPSNVVSLHGQVERRAELTWLVGAMNELPERQRYALVMRELGGLSVTEIAESLETSPESAKQLIKRGRSTVTQAAQVSGYRSKKLGRELAAAAPITAVAWLGAGKASAATTAAAAGAAGTAAAGTAAAGGAAAGAGGAGIAVLSGKAIATALAAVTIGAGGLVVGEKAVSDNTGPAGGQGATGDVRPVVPATSLVVGASAAEQAVANKKRSNERRAAAAEKRAKARARKNAAKAKARGKSRAHSGAKGNGKSSGRQGGAGKGKANGGAGKPELTATPDQAKSNGSSGTNGSSGDSPAGGSGNGQGKGKLQSAE